MFMGPLADLGGLMAQYRKVAAYLDRIYDEAKVAACMFAFPDFEHEVAAALRASIRAAALAIEHILPRLESRRAD